jgi:hypothetical protein
MVVFPEVTFTDNFFSDTFSFRNAWFQFAFCAKDRFDPDVATIFSAPSCSEEPIQSVQTATGLKYFLTLPYGWFLSVFLSFQTTLLHFLICTKVALILLLPVFSRFLLSRKTRTADYVHDGRGFQAFALQLIP